MYLFIFVSLNHNKREAIGSKVSWFPYILALGLVNHLHLLFVFFSSNIYHHKV